MERQTRYLTSERLQSVALEYDWPGQFMIEDDADGLYLRLPDCSLYFEEDSDGDVQLSFVGEGLPDPVDIRQVLSALEIRDAQSQAYLPATHYASIAKVEGEVHELCRLALTHLRPTLQGDFSWASKLS